MKTKEKATLSVLGKYEQKQIAADIFESHPKAQKVSVASDGQAFITDDGDGAAKNHAKNNRYQKVLDLTPFTRDSFLEEMKVPVGTEETDLTKKVEDIDLTKKVEDIDLTKKIEDVDLTKKVEDIDLTKKVETSNTTK